MVHELGFELVPETDMQGATEQIDGRVIGNGPGHKLVTLDGVE